MDITAKLRHVRVAPRKAGLVAALIRGKNVNDAVSILSFTRKKAAGLFQGLLKSAIANAEENHQVIDVDDLYIKTVLVDCGTVWKRQRPRARGMATTIRKRTSHLTIVLNEK